MNKRDPEHTRRLQKLHQQQTHSRFPRVWINKGGMAPSYCTSLIPMYYILYLAVVVPLAAEVMLSMMHRWHSQDLLFLLFFSSDLSPAFLSCNGTQHRQPSQWITSYKNESNFSNRGWRMSSQPRWLGCLPRWWGHDEDNDETGEAGECVLDVAHDAAARPLDDLLRVIHHVKLVEFWFLNLPNSNTCTGRYKIVEQLTHRNKNTPGVHTQNHLQKYW